VHLDVILEFTPIILLLLGILIRCGLKKMATVHDLEKLTGPLKIKNSYILGHFMLYTEPCLASDVCCES